MRCTMAERVATPRWSELAERFPAGIDYAIPFDTTRFVEGLDRGGGQDLRRGDAAGGLVVFLFLQNLRATLIPVLAVPVSLVGTFAGMYVLGFSINLLTLFGLVLAIGIVVDDAIVVLENVERIMAEEKLGAREAAIKAMEEVAGPGHRHRAGALRRVHARSPSWAASPARCTGSSPSPSRSR